MSPQDLPIRPLAAACAVARTGIGAVLLARPTVLATLMRTDSGTAQRTRWLARMFAARELTLGAGTLAAMRAGTGRAERVWLIASGVTDALDAVAMAGALKAKQVWTPMGVLGATSALGSTSIHLAAVLTAEDDE